MDNFFLLLTAVLVSIASWIFWHYLQDKGFYIICSLAMIGLVADNIKLRKTIKQLSKNKDS